MIVRILRTLIRYLVAYQNLGFISSIKIIFYSAFSKSEVDIRMKTKKFGTVIWNTKKDWVISHFYTPQIEIYSPSRNILVQTIVDMGANIGTESKRFTKLYPDAKVMAVEAEKRNFEILEKNTAEHSNVSVLLAGIWSKKSPLKIISHSESSQSWHLEEVAANKEYDIMGMTFNEIISASNFTSIDILKVDIEGSEKKLFDDSCEAWIHKVKCLIVECPDNDAPFTTSLMFRNFDKFNYKFNTYIHGENLICVRSDLDWKPRSVERYL
jgi:FkbM family methyltransferase|tara:strand:+ start:296 stop:1099 length:804 start_codon:yes stop_codon:yes gene_type:complete